MTVLLVGGQTLVVIDIGVPDLHAVFINAFQHNIVTAPCPVALGLRGNNNVTIFQGLLGFLGIKGLLFQIKTQHRGLVPEHRAICAVAVTVFAVAGTKSGGRQLRIRHVGGEHGQAGNAAAVGAELVVAVHGFAEILLQIDGNLRVPLVGNVGVQNGIVCSGLGRVL